jgi:hypothetical protein
MIQCVCARPRVGARSRVRACVRACVRVCVVELADVMLMQNWQHVMTGGLAWMTRCTQKC